MRLKLQEDTFYFPIADGIKFRNNRQTLTLKGQDIYQWIEALEPYFNGQYELETIVEDLDSEQRAMVLHIVEALLEHGFLKDLSEDLPHTLDETESSLYAAEIAFIAAFRDSAAATFERFRAQRFLVVGSGLSVMALVYATLQSGICQTTLWITDECETPIQRFQTYRQQRSARDPRQVLLEQQPPDWQDENALRDALQTFDVILHLSDRMMLQRSLLLNRLCFTLQKPLFQALLLDDQALVGPSVRPNEAGCWECAWRRCLSNTDADQQPALRDPWQNDLTSPISPLLGLPVAAMLANMLSFECFKYLTEAGPHEISGRQLHIDLETLRWQSHAFLPHPLCQVCQPIAPMNEATFLQKIHALEGQEPLKEEVFDQQATAWFDSSLGIFHYLGEDDLVQVPLNVSRLTISAPLYPEMAQEMLTTTYAHLGLAATRRQLTLQGSALYAARVADQRRSVSQGHKIWAYDLHSKQACRVPAEQGYPLAEVGQSVLSFLGISAGLSWVEACTRALLDHCRALTIQEMLLAEKPRTELNLNALMLDTQGEYLRRLVEQARKPLHIYDMTGSLRVPTLAFCLEDKTLLYTTHLDITQALNEGLKGVIQHFQAIQEEQMAYALSAAPQLPPTARGASGMLPDYSMPDGGQEGMNWLIETLHRHRWQVLALPLDNDTALTRILPFLVRVLLIREEV